MGDLAVETTTLPGCVLLGCGPWRSVESKAEGQDPLLCPGSPTSEPQRVNLSGPPPSAPQFPHLPDGGNHTHPWGRTGSDALPRNERDHPSLPGMGDRVFAAGL